jgi:hypothetical protein
MYSRLVGPSAYPRASLSRLGFPPQRCDLFVCGFGLAIRRPGVHELAALHENISATIGPLNLAADLMTHCLLDHSMGESRRPLRPKSETWRETHAP